MLFKDNFYTLISTKVEDDALNFEIKINAAHPIFQGHFPGNPVTPGVVQLEMVKELLSSHLGKEIQLVKLLNAKYLAVLNPIHDAVFAVQMTLKLQEDNTLRVSGQFANPTTVFMKFSGIYTQ